MVDCHLEAAESDSFKALGVYTACIRALDHREKWLLGWTSWLAH